MEGTLHLYHPARSLNLFEYTPLPAKETPALPFQTPPNVLLFIGGLYDNFGTPPYVSDLAKLLPRHQSQKWAVMHVQLSSAMKGWGVSNLDRDIDEVATCIKYIRETIRSNKPTNIVLMGHSTGCQDTIHYLHSANPTSPHLQTRPCVQGAAIQAPVSDREAVIAEINEKPAVKALYNKCIDLALQTPKEDWPSTLLNAKWTYPILYPAPLSISRFMSLSSPDSPSNPSQDDLFSSDLTDTRLNSTFGKIYTNNLLQPPCSDKPSTSSPAILILISGSDAAMPPTINKPHLLRRWSTTLSSSPSPHPITKNPPAHPESRVIPNAVHDISGSSPASQRARLVDMSGAVVRYLADVVGDVDEMTYQLLRENERKVVELEKGSAADEGGMEKLEKLKL